MKKKTKARKSTRKVSHKDNNLKSKIIVSVAILAVIVLIGILFQFTNIGQAIFRVDTPQDYLEGIDLDAFEAIEINIETIDTLEFKTKTTLSDEKRTFTIDLDLDEEGILEYSLSEGTKVWTKGLLGKTVLGSGNVYLDGDNVSDVELNFFNGSLRIYNSNFIEPDDSNITVIDGETKLAYAEDVKIIKAVKGQPLNLIFNVTSSVIPVVSASWDDGITYLSEEEFVKIDGGDNYTTLSFIWTPTEDIAYLLTLESITGDKITKETYIISVGSIIYSLEDTDFSNLQVKETGVGKFQTTLTLTGNEMIPFSIPCGKVELDSVLGNDKISTVYSYSKTQSVQQWKKNAPSEISSLEPNKGYLMNLIKGETSFSLTFDCGVNGASPPENTDPLTTLPTLVKGWNLVGIGGFTDVTLEKMNSKAPAGKTIVHAHAIHNDEVNLEEIITFEPGKAYWIKIE